MFDLGMSIVMLAMIGMLFLLVYIDEYDDKVAAMRIFVWVAFIGVIVTLWGVWHR